MKPYILMCLFMLGMISCGQDQTSDSNIEPAEAALLMAEDKEITVLDVRTPEEYAMGHLEGAQTLNFFDADFSESLDKLDKEKTYIVYCQAGSRSAKAIALMNSKGFTSVYNLSGGITAWEEEKQPIVK